MSILSTALDIVRESAARMTWAMKEVRSVAPEFSGITHPDAQQWASNTLADLYLAREDLNEAIAEIEAIQPKGSKNAA